MRLLEAKRVGRTNDELAHRARRHQGVRALGPAKSRQVDRDDVRRLDKSRPDGFIGEDALGPRTEQQRVNISLVTFHEAHRHAVDGAKCQVGSDLAEGLCRSARHDELLVGVMKPDPCAVIHQTKVSIDTNGYWFWGRPSIVDLWHDLRFVSSEVRPDWDLSTPGLRERWDAGGYVPFHGWNKRAGQKPPRL